jgi:hypothetical protein
MKIFILIISTDVQELLEIKTRKKTKEKTNKQKTKKQQTNKLTSTQNRFTSYSTTAS